jgi:glutathione peroxidase
VLLAVLAGFSCKPKETPSNAQESTAPSPAQTKQAASIYEFEMDDIDGNPVKLADYRGKVLLVVNVASQCGYTPQYAGLQALYGKYRDRGLAVLGFPANNFGSQEPGTNEQIRQFCTTNYNATFPMFSKISVKGDDKHPLYRYLTGSEQGRQFGAEIKWNFNKFLIDRDGNIVGVYGSKTEPQSPEMIAQIESALDQAQENTGSSQF